MVENTQGHVLKQHTATATVTKSVCQNQFTSDQPPYQNQATSQMGYLPPLSMTTQPQTQTQYHNQATGHMGFIPPAQLTTQPQTQPQNQTQSKN